MTAVKSVVWLWCLWALALAASGQQTPASPCPHIFTYENNGEKWYGKIEISAPSSTSEAVVHIKMSLGARLPTNYYGSIELLEDRGTVQNNIENGRPILYKVNFPLLSPLPKLTQIIFNGRTICTGPPEQFSSRVRALTDISLEHTLQTAGGARLPIFGDAYDNSYTYNFGEITNFGRPQASRPQPQQIQRPYQQYNPVYGDYGLTQVINNGGNDNQDKSASDWINNHIVNQAQQRPRPSWTQIPQTPPKQEFHEPSPPSSQVTEMESKPIRRPWTEPPPQTQPEPTDTYECGIANANPLFIGGDETKKGDWPWLVAMYVKKPSSLDFTCAGTLVSHRHVISAAHCVNGKNNRPVSVHEMIIKVGVFNLQDWTDGDVKQLSVSNVVSHPKYTGGLSYMDDISIFVLSKAIEFNNFITPACLWNTDTDLNRIVGRNGTVVGWGRDENGLVATPEPRVGKVPIVSTDTCRGSLPQFARLTSDNTLCAGARDGTGPCNGDSGGGMYLSMKNRWYIRAIVSLSLPGDDMPCNLNEYVVYTDTAKYLPWIRQVMAEYP